MVEEKLPFPHSKNQLLSVVEPLSYNQRFKYGSRLGRDHKDKPALRTLVDDLLKHPDPPVPEMDAEEGFTEILPAQQTSISKYYNEDQLALAIAVSAGMFDVIKARLNSPSTFFDKLVISNYVRMTKADSGKKSPATYLASDEEVSQAIMSAVPARRTLLIQESIQAKRFGVLALVAPLLESLPGFPYEKIAHYVHAWPKEKVKEFVLKNKFQNRKQNMEKLLKFHPDIFFAEMESDIKATHKVYRGQMWTSWTNWIKVDAKNKEHLKYILDIFEKYPPEARQDDNKFIYIEVPDLVKTVYSGLCKYFPDRTAELMLRTIFVAPHYENAVEMPFAEAFLQSGVSHQIQTKYVMRIISLVGKAKDFWTRKHRTTDYALITNYIPNRLIPRFSNTHQMKKLLKIGTDFLLAHPATTKESEITWFDTWKKYFSAAVDLMQSKFYTSTSTITVKERKETEKMKKDVAKYRAAIFDAVDLFLPVIIDKAVKNIEDHTQFEYREANVMLDIYTMNLKDRVVDPYVIESRLKWLQPYLLTLIKALPAKTQHQRQDTRVIDFLSDIARSVKDYKGLKVDEDHARKVFVDIFNFIKANFPEEYFTRNKNDNFLDSLFNLDKDLTFSLFFPLFSSDPLKHVNLLKAKFLQLNSDQQQQIYKYFSKDALVHLAQQDFSTFAEMVDKLPVDLTTPVVNHLLETPKLIDENTRKFLIGFQDLADHKARNSLQKASNSNSANERSEVLEALITATRRSQDPTQLTRTLKFIREKIKNESQENRASILGYLFSGDQWRPFLFPEGLGEAQFSIWFEILSDALESQDLDENVLDRSNFTIHPVLKYIQKLGEAAVEVAQEKHGKRLNSGIFEFGTELLWKLLLFRHGEKKAAEKFSIKYHHQSFDVLNATPEERNEAVGRLVTKIRETYHEKRTKKFPEWQAQYTFQQFFTFYNSVWPSIPELVQVVEAHISEIKANRAKDDEGLYLIENPDAVLEILKITIQFVPKEKWDLPIIRSLWDLIIHSRQAPVVLTHWVSWKEMGAKSAREFKERKDKYVAELLQVSPSAIHLRFVWRHLLTYDQVKLDNFIGKKKSFRGVFYVEPENRKFIRSALKVPETKRPGGRVRTKTAKRGTKAGSLTLVIRAQATVDTEKHKEAVMLQELEELPRERWDHPDLWYLEACYGLHRLLPRQVNVLAGDWKGQILNNDRAIPAKVQATARWTIMPTVTYNDIVSFLNEYENGKQGETTPLSVNVIETLLRGVMRNDEPTAPLNFLLSPKFLASDRSRVSVYAISQSVPHMPPDGLTNMIKLCLTGKRRHQLKISAYKEVIRLLASTPTKTHLEMIYNEWSRPDLHRDVCIAILHNVVPFLKIKQEEFQEIAWKILEGATTREKPEILLAVLGPASESRGARPAIPPDCFLNKQLSEAFTQTNDLVIPRDHELRFVKNVVLPIANTAKNSDVYFTALWSLSAWPVVDQTIPLVVKYLKDLSPSSLLYSSVVKEVRVFTSRWRAMTSTFSLVNFRDRTDSPSTLDLITTVCDRVSKMTNSERSVRATALPLMRHLFSSVPNFLSVDESKYLSPFLVFGMFDFEQRMNIIRSTARSDEESKRVSSLIHDVTLHYIRFPTQAENVTLNIARQAIWHSLTIKQKLISQLKVVDDPSPITSTPEYLYIMRALALHALDKTFVRTHPDIALQFWQKQFDFVAERKDLPREHQKASELFSLRRLLSSIGDNLDLSDANHAEKSKKLLTDIIRR